jgi:DNA-binding CsgD family transcriptional regulator
MIATIEHDAPATAPLTPREREVIEMALDGASNPEIARRLWVTKRTVEFHLTNAYRKLGVAGRWELAARESQSNER